MKKIITMVLVLAALALIPCVASAGHWYTFHDLNYMIDAGDYNALTMRPVNVEADRIDFVGMDNPAETMTIIYYKGYYPGRGNMNFNDIGWGEAELMDFVHSFAGEPNIQPTSMGYAYKGNRDDLICFSYEYTYTDATGYNGLKEIMMLKNGEDLYLVVYHNNADALNTDNTRGFVHYYYYFGERREGDESAPEYVAPPLPINLVIDGSEVVSDAEPLIVDGRTMVPVRTVANGLGYAVEWDESTKTVILTRDKTTLLVDIGHDIIRKQWIEYDNTTGRDELKSEQYKADVPAQIIADRTYLPVRAVSEALGCLVDWNGDTRTVSITTVKEPEPEIEFVFIGETGNLYHKKSNCPTMPMNTSVGVPYDFAVGQDRTPCEVCWE